MLWNNWNDKNKQPVHFWWKQMREKIQERKMELDAQKNVEIKWGNVLCMPI